MLGSGVWPGCDILVGMLRTLLEHGSSVMYARQEAPPPQTEMGRRACASRST